MKKFSGQQCYSSIDEAIASFKDSRLDAPIAIKQQSVAARKAARFFSAHEYLETYRDFLRYIAWYSWPTRFVEGASYGIYDVLRRESRLGEKTIQYIKRHIERKGLREYFEPRETLVIFHS